MTKRQITITECDHCGFETQEAALGVLRITDGDRSDHWDICFGCQVKLKAWMRKEGSGAY